MADLSGFELAEGEGHKYDPLEIPADWEEAYQHAESRITGPAEIIEHKLAELCPCCGYVVSRIKISVFCDTMDLSFLGSGFPCFYNFIKYCLVMLMLLLSLSGIYNIYTSYGGTYCNHPDLVDQALSGKV